MLSTSRTKLQNQYLLVAVAILVLVSAIVVYTSGVLPTISAGQPATQNLTTLSAADISAYRWDAMAKFYAAQGAQIPVTGANLTTLSAADVSAYRWEAMAKFYAGQTSAAVNLSWPPRPDFSHLNETAMIPITGSAAGLAIYHQSEWSAPVVIQNSLAQYYLSERGTFAAIQDGLDIYHQSEQTAAQDSAIQYGPPGR
ncbi:MAG: hypothetical protein JW963_18465 [Anaerolineales bacterium]|nr:hypothetical protein [Anaerolineales bacterium]